jgi:hypothetical protein
LLLETEEKESDAILAVGGLAAFGIVALAAIRLGIRNVGLRSVRPGILRFGQGKLRLLKVVIGL